jgi:outer membrane cobalamin receptor
MRNILSNGFLRFCARQSSKGLFWLRRIAPAIIFGFLSLCVYAQNDAGELRLQLRDSTGLPLQCSAEVVSKAAEFRVSSTTDRLGNLTLRALPFGLYSVRVRHPGFSDRVLEVQITSRVPLDVAISLAIEPVTSNIVVNAADTLLDPRSTGSISQVGTTTLETRSASLPGRSVIDLVVSQPGWLLESNGVLHPRGSEYQVQYIIDGVPYTENRSPSFAPGADVDDVQSMQVLTSDFPAEYGRKLGGVIEVNSKSHFEDGLHGEFVASGGSFDTAAGHGSVTFVHDKTAIRVSGEDEGTDRYLDPPVAQNYTNHGTIHGGQLRFDRELSAKDHLTFSLEHKAAQFEVPDEFVQQQAGQVQFRRAPETTGTATYEHVISKNALVDFRIMSRDVSASLFSNQNSTPIIANQQRGFRETYAKSTVSILQTAVHNLKAGIDVDYSTIQEQFGYQITNFSFFDSSTPAHFAFNGSGDDREESAFIEDNIHLGQWTVSAGLRYDHYDLLVNRSALSPRIGVGWYWPRAALNLHASFDRAFQTPALENILLSSSPATQMLNSNVLRLPVQPSVGDYWNIGITKSLFGQLRMDADWYRRSARDFADDDVLLNTSVSFPISFRRGAIYGAEAKLLLPQWKRFSGFINYSYMVGFAFTPVTGGLFLGNDASSGLSGNTRFPVSQDQRNTVSGREVLQITPRFWIAGGLAYGSGLPTEFDGTIAEALQQYGATIVDRVNFDRDRIRPSLAINVGLGLSLYKRGPVNIRFQADGENLNNRLNLINFAGLFSGTGIAAPRNVGLRLQSSF